MIALFIPEKVTDKKAAKETTARRSPLRKQVRRRLPTKKVIAVRAANILPLKRLSMKRFLKKEPYW